MDAVVARKPPVVHKRQSKWYSEIWRSSPIQVSNAVGWVRLGQGSAGSANSSG
jgi:hypothetical protein